MLKVSRQWATAASVLHCDPRDERRQKLATSANCEPSSSFDFFDQNSRCAGFSRVLRMYRMTSNLGFDAWRDGTHCRLAGLHWSSSLSDGFAAVSRRVALPSVRIRHHARPPRLSLRHLMRLDGPPAPGDLGRRRRRDTSVEQA